MTAHFSQLLFRRDLRLFWIRYMHKKKTAGRRRHPGLFPVAGCHDGREIRHEIPHHPVQEAIPADRKEIAVPDLIPVRLVHGPHRRCLLAAMILEGRKIMRPHKERCRFIHGLQRRFFPDQPGITLGTGIGQRGIIDFIPIGLIDRVEAGMEGIWHIFRFPQGNILRQQMRHSAPVIFRRDGRTRSKGNDLAQGVDTRIRPPRRLDEDGFPQGCAQCLFQDLLDSPAPGLTLEALLVRPVIGNDCLDRMPPGHATGPQRSTARTAKSSTMMTAATASARL